MRTVFMGTPEIAVPALRLLAARTTVTLVVTQPDRPAGRGHKLTPPPVKVAALELGLPVWQPETLRGAGDDPRLDCDLAVVMAYGELLRQEVLDRPRWGCINLHGSLLPRWRGASPLQAALRAGDRRTGVTVMRMVRGLDAGPMFLSEGFDLPHGATLPWLHDTLAACAATALGRFLDTCGEAGPTLPAIEQDPSDVTLCRKLTAEDGKLDPQATAADTERWVRAYTPAPGCWVPWNGERLKVLAVAVSDRVDIPAGELRQDGVRWFLGCKDGAVELLRIQAPGRSAMNTADFLRGARTTAS